MCRNIGVVLNCAAAACRRKPTRLAGLVRRTGHASGDVWAQPEPAQVPCAPELAPSPESAISPLPNQSTNFFGCTATVPPSQGCTRGQQPSQWRSMQPGASFLVFHWPGTLHSCSGIALQHHGRGRVTCTSTASLGDGLGASILPDAADGRSAFSAFRLGASCGGPPGHSTARAAATLVLGVRTVWTANAICPRMNLPHVFWAVWKVQGIKLYRVHREGRGAYEGEAAI